MSATIWSIGETMATGAASARMVRWTWQSMKPGSMVRPARSTWRTLPDDAPRLGSPAPTATIVGTLGDQIAVRDMALAVDNPAVGIDGRFRHWRHVRRFLVICVM